MFNAYVKVKPEPAPLTTNQIKEKQTNVKNQTTRPTLKTVPHQKRPSKTVVPNTNKTVLQKKIPLGEAKNKFQPPRETRNSISSKFRKNVSVKKERSSMPGLPHTTMSGIPAQKQPRPSMPGTGILGLGPPGMPRNSKSIFTQRSRNVPSFSGVKSRIDSGIKPSTKVMLKPSSELSSISNKKKLATEKSYLTKKNTIPNKVSNKVAIEKLKLLKKSLHTASSTRVSGTALRNKTNTITTMKNMRTNPTECLKRKTVLSLLNPGSKDDENVNNTNMMHIEKLSTTRSNIGPPITNIHNDLTFDTEALVASTPFRPNLPEEHTPKNTKKWTGGAKTPQHLKLPEFELSDR